MKETAEPARSAHLASAVEILATLSLRDARAQFDRAYLARVIEGSADLESAAERVGVSTGHLRTLMRKHELRAEPGPLRVTE